MSVKKQQPKKQSNTKQDVPDGLLDMLKPDNMMSNAQKVITSAVNVLEEEIAAGILAAKNIEKKVLDFDLADTKAENLMSRIRRDTHEALDIFLDAFASLTKQVGLLTDSMNKENGKQNASTHSFSKNGGLFFEHDMPVRAGEEAQIKVALRDDQLKENMLLHFLTTDFTGSNGQRIPLKYLRIEPAECVLKPSEDTIVVVCIQTPKNCKPGLFSGLLTITEKPELRMIVSFEVVD